MLGSFVQRTSQKLSLLFISTVPRVLRVQRYYFFLSLKHFCQLFFIFFHFPSSTLKDNALQRAKQAEKRQFGGLSAKKTLFKGTYRDKKHRKISQIRTFCGKTERDWLASCDGLRQKKRRKAQETGKRWERRTRGPHRAGQDGRQRILRSQRRRDSQRKRTPY